MQELAEEKKKKAGCRVSDGGKPRGEMTTCICIGTAQEEGNASEAGSAGAAGETGAQADDERER